MADDDVPEELTAADVRGVAFSKPPIGQRGYNEDEVDDLLDNVERRLADPRAVSRPTAADVAATSFSKPPLGKRGYSEDEVDGFLERVVRQLEKSGDDIAPAHPAPAVAGYVEVPPPGAPPKKWWRIW